MFMDSDHAEDNVSHRTRSDFLIYVNKTLLQQFLKKQLTVEMSVFGPDFIPMKQGIDALRGLRYKLMMMGILLSSPLYIYGHNVSAVYNTFRTESVLKKKKLLSCIL